MRIQQLIGDCIRRRSAGEDVSDDDLIASHTELLPELEHELRKLRLVERARRRAESTATLGPGEAAALPAAPQIDGYEIVREIHHGGQGVVYQAIQKSTRRKVAIKLLHGGPFVEARARARLQREIQILGQLQHPNIVAIHDSGTAAGCPYFVMDYIPGDALDVYVRGRNVATVETLRLFAKICDAVNAAHLRGVIHRDLKPSNIRVDPEGEPHVLDFGLARVIVDAVTGDNEHLELMSVTGQFIGSLPWAAPEQAEGSASKVDLRTDVYALGAILYQMLTGQMPYELTGNARELLDRIMTVTPAPPSALRPGLDRDVDTIVLRCLAKERERRYQTAGELARDVRNFLAGEAIDARRDSTIYLLRKRLRRYRVSVAVTAGFILVVLAGLFTSLGFWRQAERNAERAELVADFLDEVLLTVDPDIAAEDRGSPLYTALREALERADQRLDELSEEPEVAARVRSTLGHLYTSLGMYAEAVEQLQAALGLRREVYGEQSAATAETRYGLAIALAELGHYDDALALLENALEVNTALYGTASLEVARVLEGMGEVHFERGELQLAEKYLTDSLTLRQKLSAPRADIARSLAWLGSTQRRLERLDEAEANLRAALAIRQELFGPLHPQALFSLNRLGLLLKAAGRLDEARNLFEETLELRKQVVGPGHPHVAVSHFNLARTLVALDDDVAAVPHFQEALRIWRHVQPVEHAETRAAVLNLAGALGRLGRTAEAETLLLDRYEELRIVLGVQDARTIEVAQFIARLYEDTGRAADAAPWRALSAPER